MNNVLQVYPETKGITLEEMDALFRDGAPVHTFKFALINGQME